MSARPSLALAAAAALLAAPATGRADRAAAAVGLAAGWQQRSDFGENTRASFVPELVGFGYLRLGETRLFLRPGLRLAYAGLSQAEMPHAVQIEERDLIGSGELGLLFDGPVIPSLTAGGGAASRWISLDVREPATAGRDRISRHQLLGTGYLQAGLGIPLVRGLLVIEPVLRYELTAGDDRSRWRYGVELTAQIF